MAMRLWLAAGYLQLHDTVQRMQVSMAASKDDRQRLYRKCGKHCPCACICFPHADEQVELQGGWVYLRLPKCAFSFLSSLGALSEPRTTVSVNKMQARTGT
eukprot:1147663-Pelagomonas_calceolata.AAC.2